MSRHSSFETEMLKCFQSSPLVSWVYRPTDSGGYGRRFAVKNPIDLVGVLRDGRALLCECKARKNATSIPFNVFSDDQWDALSACASTPAVVFAAFEFYAPRDRGVALLVPFGELARTRDELDRKSWPRDLLHKIGIELVKLTNPASWLIPLEGWDPRD
jgi:penicillin-binding protein-related factor A (putative recombinase)